MRDSGNKSTRAFMLITAGLLMLGFVVLICFGAITYRNAVSSQTANDDRRALLAYISTAAAGNDSKGAIYVSGTEDEPVLVMADGDTGYGIRIFLYDGELMEDYGLLENDPNPDAAQKIGETSEFNAVMRDDGLIEVSCDEGHVLVAGHCPEGGLS